MARQTKNIRQRDTFIVLTNGKETERNYFEALRGFRHSIYDVKVKFINADPLGLVRRAIREKSSSNQVWIVFDKDEFLSDAIDEAIHLAHENKIGIAISNAAFEVWLINHFTEFNVEKTSGELCQVLDVFLKNEGYSAGYVKNDSEVMRNLFLPKLDIAMHNASVSLQRRIAEYKQAHPFATSYPYCNWNPCTTVHKLIEAMKLDSKE